MVEGVKPGYFLLYKEDDNLREAVRTKPTGGYETMNLYTPYRLIDLMLNRIFSQANGKFYKIGWVPVIYFVAIKGIIFN